MSLGIQNIPLTQRNICLKYLGDEFISFPCTGSEGASFFVLGTDVTADITDINYGSFTTDIVAIIDPSIYIVDDALNSYCKVVKYTSTSTTRPSRV